MLSSSRNDGKKPVKVPGLVIAAVAALFMVATSPGQTNVVESPWEGSAVLGLTLTRGNSETLLVNMKMLGTRKRDRNELHLGLDGTYGESSGDKNNEQLKGFTQYNRIFGDDERWYFYGRVEALHDAIADIEGRFNIAPGVGYYVAKNKKISLAAETGPGVVVEKNDGEEWTTFSTFRAADRFEYKINHHAKVWQTAEILPDLGDFENYNVNAEIGIETAITVKWGLRVVLENSYDHEPSPGRKENDLKLIAGVSYRF
jgi:putative salt-induced outer membrane protein YdiY